MTRPIRLDSWGALFHIISRGNEKREIYRDDEDYRRFTDFLGENSRRYGFRVHAYALMPNHYHLLLETPRGELSRGLHRLNGAYSQYFNRRHLRVGHLFQGRFKALLVEADSYLLTLSRYIHQNPAKAGLVSMPWLYPWSSCRDYLGLRDGPPWLETRMTLGHFGAQIREQRGGYVRFLLRSPEVEPEDAAVAQLVLGSEGFVEAALQQARRIVAKDAECGPAQRILQRPNPDDVIRIAAESIAADFPTSSNAPCPGLPSRDLTLYLLHEVSLLSLREAGAKFSLSPSGACRRISNFRARLAGNPAMRFKVEHIASRALSVGQPVKARPQAAILKT